MVVSVDRWLVAHLFLPLVALGIISVLITIGDVDRNFADYFYGIQANQWAWKDSWVAETFLHKGGRAFSILLASILLFFLIASHFNDFLAVHKKSLLYLFLATAGSSLLISFLKPLLAVSCPWEFDRYGGGLPYINVVNQLFLRSGEGCFPAGHASAGYAWISCYFLGLFYQSKWRWPGLALPLLAGIVLGFAQQIRGAHFISHDLWALALCWFYSLSLFVVFFKIPLPKKSVSELICL